MKHTECKDCELSNSDCGYHFKMDGVTNYDIASLSACDKYGNCEFFKPKANLQGDLINREALKLDLAKEIKTNDMGLWLKILLVIDNAPTVDVSGNEYFPYRTAYFNGVADGRAMARPQGEWITDNLHNTICNKCGGIRRDNRVEYIAFCNKCGAKMKGGAE